MRFLEMGGYAVPWPCYALTLLVLAANFVSARRTLVARSARPATRAAEQMAGSSTGAGSA